LDAPLGRETAYPHICQPGSSCSANPMIAERSSPTRQLSHLGPIRIPEWKGVIGQNLVWVVGGLFSKSTNAKFAYCRMALQRSRQLEIATAAEPCVPESQVSSEQGTAGCNVSDDRKQTTCAFVCWRVRRPQSAPRVHGVSHLALVYSSRRDSYSGRDELDFFSGRRFLI
jgi:hypothetical protein